MFASRNLNLKQTKLKMEFLKLEDFHYNMVNFMIDRQLFNLMIIKKQLKITQDVPVSLNCTHRSTLISKLLSQVYKISNVENGEKLSKIEELYYNQVWINKIKWRKMRNYQVLNCEIR